VPDPNASPRAPATPRIAVALQYEPAEGGAPSVVASGRGESAEQIVEAAAAHDIPVRADAALAGLLGQLKIGVEIPPEAFAAVAEILVWLYRLDGTLPARVPDPSPPQPASLYAGDPTEGRQ
jgi:flagellar biosynthesis protein